MSFLTYNKEVCIWYIRNVNILSNINFNIDSDLTVQLDSRFAPNKNRAQTALAKEIPKSIMQFQSTKW